MTFVLCTILGIYVFPALVTVLVIRRARRRRERLAARKQVGRLR